MKRFLIYAVWVLIIALVVLTSHAGRLQKENNRLSGNQETLLSEIEHYKTSDSLNAAGVDRLVFTNKEFKKYCRELEKTVESLNIKVNRLQSVSRTVTETKYIIETMVRDSVLPGGIDSLKCIDFRNNYVTLAGCVDGERFSGVIESRDTIDQVVHRVPRRFLFFRWGCKAIRQEIVSRNPHSRITYTQYIELK